MNNETYIIELKDGVDVPSEFVDNLFEMLNELGYEFEIYGLYGEYKVGKLRIGYQDNKYLLVIGVDSGDEE